MCAPVALTQVLKTTLRLVKARGTQRASQAVPHPSTDRALRRLTSEFGRDPVYSPRYGREQQLDSALTWDVRKKVKKQEKMSSRKEEARRHPYRWNKRVLEFSCLCGITKREQQIVGTWEKSQWIDTQRSLSHLQYPDATKSSANDLSLSQLNL